jgi:hypothetical protein
MLLAVVWARWRRLRTVVGFLAPSIVDASAWYGIFEEEPEFDWEAIYLGCDMKDGSYLAGVLHWYSTEVEETADRDLVLEPPLLRRREGQDDPLQDFERVIISARDISTLYVTWLTAEGLEDLAGHAAPP